MWTKIVNYIVTKNCVIPTTNCPGTKVYISSLIYIILINIVESYLVCFIFVFFNFSFYRDATVVGLYREILRKIRYDAGKQISAAETQH